MPYLKERPSILKRSFKIKIGNMPRIWETNSEILGMKIGYEHQILQKSNHILIVSKEDNGRETQNLFITSNNSGHQLEGA